MLLIGFLVFHLIQISFVNPEVCAIIFNTASSVNKFMKQQNKQIKKLYTLLLMCPLFYFYLQRRSTKPEICKFTFTTASSIANISKFHFFQYRFFILLYHKCKYQRRSIKYYRTDLSFPESYFYGMKKKTL